MTRVGSRELKTRLGTYLGRVKRGETILVTDRGKAVAKLSPADTQVTPPQSIEQVLDRLEAEGMIRRGRLPFVDHAPVKAKGKPASQMIIEDRR